MGEQTVGCVFNHKIIIAVINHFLCIDSQDSWESGEGWFLHPQSNEELSGEIQVSSSSTSDSYVGFGIDDEIMSAIRNELLSKLPHAQVKS